MKKIKRNKVKVKNLIGIVESPEVEDLLFEIVDFLESESRTDGEFRKGEVSLKTRCRIGEEVVDDLKLLVEMGYLEKVRRGIFKVVKHPWE